MTYPLMPGRKAPQIDMSELEAGEAPESPFVAFLTGLPNEWTAIPVGATIRLVFDPKKEEMSEPLVLVRLTKQGLDFRCPCGQRTCTKEVRLKLVRKGRHPRRGEKGATP